MIGAAMVPDDTIRVYTDGACRGNPGRGGWGVVIEHGRDRTEANGADADTTNNRMELTAAIEALERIAPGPHVRITTDSSYVRNGITQWVEAWRSNGWKTSRGTAVKNRDLWQRLAEACAQRSVSWQWVKGHSGHPGNSRADKLARDGLLGRIIGHAGEPQAPPSTTPAPADGSTLVRVYLARQWCARRGRGGARHGHGAWAAVIEDGTHTASITGVVDDTTKQRLELNAAVEGLRQIAPAREVEVHTCSRYLEDGITLWIDTWIRQNWYRGAGGRIKNHDLWSALAAERERVNVHWQWHQAEAAGPGCGRAAAIAHRSLGEARAG